MQKIILFVVLAITQTLFSQTTYDLVFKNANIVSMENDNVLLNQNIAILNGKIVVIENAKKSKLKAKKTIDLKGKYIMPSLADAHVHLPETEEELQRMFDLNLINGVTKLRSMRGDWKHKEWQNKFNTINSIYPKIYLSAPPISRNLEASTAQLEEFVKAVKDNNYGFIKILSIKNQEIFTQLDSLCKKYDVPLGGHFPRLAMGNSLNEDVFFNSNYKSIEHLGGLVGEPNLIESRIQAIKKNDIYICPTLLWYSIGSGQYSYEQLEKLNGMEFVSKLTMQEWIEKTKVYREKIGEQAYKDEVAKELKDLQEKYQVIARLQKEGIKMLLSPDASSKYMMTGCNMVNEMELLKNVNLSNFEILQMATVNFANFHKEYNGVIKVNKPADFIILDKNPLENLQTLRNVKGVFFNYNYLDTKALEDMKKKLLDASSK
ncbi:amidohydrolase family protein [Flavobacterium channae]|uniref:amidohydrolase family protein n=1 Tax=Flavobacterium channae TaxID=2897181 RepID=UPI001E3A597B|nr:amidohydrolase family protein [Flavobacterium channae]UGS23056.1 amidohydrolase family protein [Flavobacterium channae]